MQSLYIGAAYGDMAKLAHAPDLGSGEEIHAGSIPVIPTNRRFILCTANHTPPFQIPVSDCGNSCDLIPGICLSIRIGIGACLKNKCRKTLWVRFPPQVPPEIMGSLHVERGLKFCNDPDKKLRANYSKTVWQRCRIIVS